MTQRSRWRCPFWDEIKYFCSFLACCLGCEGQIHQCLSLQGDSQVARSCPKFLWGGGSQKFAEQRLPSKCDLTAGSSRSKVRDNLGTSELNSSTFYHLLPQSLNSGIQDSACVREKKLPNHPHPGTGRLLTVLVGLCQEWRLDLLQLTLLVNLKLCSNKEVSL